MIIFYKYPRGINNMNYKKRKEIYKEIETLRKSNVICYITGDRKHFETQIHEEVLNFFIHHLDNVTSKKISLILYTRGGKTLAAWSLVNLLHQFCDELEIIIPMKAHSAGTLICLGAHKIIMTKQATLGPIDPSVNTPLNPAIPNMGKTYPVNVEAIKGYIEFVKKEFQVKDNLSSIITALSDKIHPLVLGEVYRARNQIKMLADKLLSQHLDLKAKKKKIIDFLCSESGSHDYTINRKEAQEDLGLNIEKPDDKLYSLIREIYNSIDSELELTSDFKPEIIVGDKLQKKYSCKRALIESVNTGSHFFVTDLIIKKIDKADSKQIKCLPTFEGWKYYGDNNK